MLGPTGKVLLTPSGKVAADPSCCCEGGACPTDCSGCCPMKISGSVNQPGTGFSAVFSSNLVPDLIHPCQWANDTVTFIVPFSPTDSRPVSLRVDYTVQCLPAGNRAGGFPGGCVPDPASVDRWVYVLDILAILIGSGIFIDPPLGAVTCQPASACPPLITHAFHFPDDGFGGTVDGTVGLSCQ